MTNVSLFRAVLLALASPATLLAAEPAASVRLVANEGFLIESGEHKVAIDAVFDDRSITFADVPDEAVLERARSGSAPFDSIDLFLVTHDHRDHFSAEPVHRLLASSPSTTLIGPPQVVDELRHEAPELFEAGERIHAIELGMFEGRKLDVGGIGVRAFRLKHSRYMETDEATGERVDRHAGVENLAYVVEMDGFSFVHLGDALPTQNEPFFAGARSHDGGVDVAFVACQAEMEAASRMLRQWVNPREIVPMHLPPGERESEVLVEQRQQRGEGEQDDGQGDGSIAEER